MLKQIVILGLLVFPLFVGAQNPTDVSCIYEATWEGPFFTTLLGKLGGYLPGCFSFYEARWKHRHGSEEFFMALDNLEGKAWMRLHSDTTHESAVWLPRKPKEILNTDVIRFVRTLRKMFMDSSRHTMKGTFIFSKRKLFAEAGEFALSQDEAQKFGPARAFSILTFDTTGTPGIRGRIVVARDSVLHYRKVTMYIPDDDIEVTLEEQNEK
jgi:hypothetical protein